VPAPPASSVTATAGQRAQAESARSFIASREVTLDPGASADTPVRRQGPGGSLPGPDASHPLQGAVALLPDGLRRVGSNRDSNSSDQRQAAATGDSA
jgi:hypothetical protein